MKAIKKITLLVVVVLCVYYESDAQSAPAATTNRTMLITGRMEPYRMEVTYNKTSHLIFPSAIRYVDLGSDYLIASKAEDAENVLRIKATVRGFEEETNFSVITEDGNFYNFDVYYTDLPATTNYDLLKMAKYAGRQNTSDVLLRELGSNPPSLAGMLLETIYTKDKRVVRHIASKSYGIQFILKGIYVYNGKYYFHTEMKNRSNVPFQVDFVTFTVIDKKVAKRTVAQERLLKPLRIYRPLDAVAANKTERNVFLLDQFTIADDKVLLIEIFEKNGGRHQLLRVENADLVHAKSIKDMHIKIN